jgi:pyridoxal phosphate enzyme (YggS family)
MSIQRRLDDLLVRIPPTVKLVAVSKNHSAGEILEAYQCGQRRFGENRVQELVAKQPLLPQDIEWHFIGHLQTNKVRSIIPFVSLIQSIDSLKLLSEVNNEAGKINRKVDCLLEMHIAAEDTKFGLDLESAGSLLGSEDFRAMQNINIKGVMGMATFTSDTQLVRSEFRNLRNCFDFLKIKYFPEKNTFTEISMGMSDDFPAAIEEGSTIVRIGTAIFGERTPV